MIVMAERRPLYAQLPDMPAGKVLEDVFAQAAGFSQADQNDEYFIPEMSRAETVLFPNDSPMALGKMASQRRFEMVGRAVDQLRREGFLAGTRFASFHATLAALRDAAGARAAGNENHFSSVTVALRPADIPAAQAVAIAASRTVIDGESSWT